MKTSLSFLLVSCVVTCSMLTAQSVMNAPSRQSTRSACDTASILNIAQAFIHDHLGEWKLTQNDITGMKINKLYKDKTTGITRVRFLQHYKNIPVNNAIINLSITQDGKVFFSGNRFVPNLASKVNTSIPVVKPHEALVSLASHYGLPAKEPALKKQTGENAFLFDKGEIASEDIITNLRYELHGNDVRLSWNILLAPVQTHDKWNAHVDAVSGYILDEFNWTVYCPAHGEGSTHDNDAYETTEAEFNNSISGAQYNVWPAPIESPNHGPRSVAVNPHNTVASPFGWHDINGFPGADFTVTRGNNCYAYQDRANIGHSSYDEPDGGPDLHFDAPFNPAWEPDQYTDAAVLNLFYWTNYMHDFAYPFGFDEAAGNFQMNNYGNGGLGGDPIFGVAQAGAEAGNEGNPHYKHANEGAFSVIFMEEFDRVQRTLNVIAPTAIGGTYVTALVDIGWGAGASVTSTPVTAEVILAQDGVEDPLGTDACEEIVNSNELAGKIALIDRGGCEFGWKALNAQNAGAIGVIFCNFDDSYTVTFGPGVYGALVEIPVVMISFTDAQRIRQHAGNGLIATLIRTSSGPDARDFALDNGFIAHEYGHGITWRLSGGPDAMCIENEEQMDEGWSDFFAIATTARVGDTGAQPRGIGTYIYDEPISGRGNRRYPYSTDMSVNPLTYADLVQSDERHDVGEVWGAMIWDMYWALVDEYGFNQDLHDPSSGNHKAIRLVFDAIKSLPCHPGFVDGRDAILAADEVLYDGVHECLLWKVFARRGIGYGAEQGSPYHVGDQVASFDIPPTCTEQILVQKSMTEFIHPGNDIEVQIKVSNYKNAAVSNVIVNDEIPAGTTYKSSSSPFPVSIQGSSISFQVGSLEEGQEAVISYTLGTPSSAWSLRKFLDDVPEPSNSKWLVYSNGSNNWSITDDFPAHSGNYAWYAQEQSLPMRQSLELNSQAFTFHVEGSNPALCFYHRYVTNPGVNGGIVEVREAGTAPWRQVSSDFIRNGYPGYLFYPTFALPYLNAFSGNSGDAFKASYIDLSDWMDKHIQIRFRFGTYTDSTDGTGWLIDDIEFMNLLAYNGEACVTTDQGDLECTIAPEGGTIVESKEEISSGTRDLGDIATLIYPNPASDHITVVISESDQQEFSINLQSVDGKELFRQSIPGSGKGSIDINTTNLPAGLYFIKVWSDNSQHVEKIVIQND